MHHFGFFEGLYLIIQLKIFKKEYINLKNYGTIHLRQNSSDIGIFNQIFIEKEYNIKLSFEPKFIVDAGANIGLTSLFFAQKFPLAKIVSLEPEMENFKNLKFNTKNWLEVIPLNKALWSKDATISLIKSSSYDSHTVSVPNNVSETVEAISLSSLITEYNPPRIDILKIDIEGAEKEVFDSEVKDWLPKIKILVVELHDRFKPGCSKSLFKALYDYKYNMSIKGELLIFEFLDN